jgi:hypothetical protein
MTVCGLVLMGFAIDNNFATSQFNLLLLFSSTPYTIHYYSYSITNTLSLYIHITAYTEVSLIASSLSKSSITDSLQYPAFIEHYKTCAVVLVYLLPFYDLHDPSVPRSL